MSAVVQRMTRSLEHRGPDGEGFWSDEAVSLGHRRLAIIDTSAAAAQPMMSSTGDFVIVFNGEIYNHRVIAQQLEAGGWVARSSSDTEILLGAIECWGLERTLERLDGMFAFALYDRRQRTVTLARDRFGEKPLAYSLQEGVLWFASEQRAFDVAGGPELVLSPISTRAYFRYGYVPAPRSIYADVQKLPPASHVTFTAGVNAAPRFRRGEADGLVRRYWRISPFTSEQRNSDPDEGLELLRRSVSNRLISDRPVGAFLSGGIDSSLTCALAAEAMEGPLTTFTMTWESKEHDESVRARRVAEALGTKHHEVAFSLANAAAVAERVGFLLDEPHADYSVIGVNLVAHAAREHFVVALSGDGGDELFGGYYRHVWLPRAEKFRRSCPHKVRRATVRGLTQIGPMVDLAGRLVPVSRRPRLLADKAAKLCRAVSSVDLAASYDSGLTVDSSVPDPVDLPAEVLEAIGSADSSAQLWGLRVADILGYLPDDVLTKVDRATMNASLESRTPFLNPDLVAHALRLDKSELVKGQTGKLLLRRWLRAVLPDADFRGPKAGFGTPIPQLMRGPMLQVTQEAMRSFLRRPPSLVGSQVVWQQRLERFLRGEDQEAHRVWSAVAFEMWAERRNHNIIWQEGM
jgi:asparagine synthase (glutamine-hydrolysing)